MNIRIDIRETNVGHCIIDDLDELKAFAKRKDNNDNAFWFHYTSCEDKLKVTVSHGDKDHIFDDVSDAINFIETLFIIETNAPD